MVTSAKLLDDVYRTEKNFDVRERLLLVRRVLAYKLEREGTPIRVFQDIVDKLSYECDCDGENMRHAEINKYPNWDI